MLRSLAERLDVSIRPGDLLARSSRDQFAVLCPEITSFPEVIRMAERLVTVTNEVLDVPASGGWSTAGAGVAFPHLPGETPERLLAKAESAAALARSSGGEQVEVIIGTGPGSSDAMPAPAFPGFDLGLEAGAGPDPEVHIDVAIDLTDAALGGERDDESVDSTVQEHLSTASAPLQDPPPH